MSSNAGVVSRLIVGEPLRSDRLGETLLPKRLALPVFCSDPLSSVAYATEQIVRGNGSAMNASPWVCKNRIGHDWSSWYSQIHWSISGS